MRRGSALVVLAVVAGLLAGSGLAFAAFTVRQTTPQQFTAADTLPTVRLSAQSRTNDGGASGQQILFGLRLRNTGDAEVPLGNVTMRYWFTADNRTGDPIPACYYAASGCESATLRVVRLGELFDRADNYLEVSFTATSLAAGDDVQLDQLALRDPAGGTYRQDNDFSFSAATSFTDNLQVTVYVDGQLVWGAEPDPVRPTEESVEVDYRNLDGDTADPAIEFQLRVFNTGTVPLDLTRVKVRYWFTREAGSSEMLGFCDYAQLGCSTFKITFGTVSPARPGADTYVEVTGLSGTGGVGGNTGPVQLRLHKSDYSPFDETDDHSWDTNTAFARAPRVTAYIDGQLVWGTEP